MHRQPPVSRMKASPRGMLLVLALVIVGLCGGARDAVADETHSNEVSLALSVEERAFDYLLNARVDTTDSDVRAVVGLWLDYLQARHDGDDGRRFWYRSEVERWDVFNLFAPTVFQNPHLLDVYDTVVLSAEREHADRLCIRTMFYSQTLEPPDDRQNPWAITRVYAQREGDGATWRLRNALGVLTEDWRRSRLRFITFVYPPTHRFDLERAARSVSFCDSIAEVFPFLEIEPFEFYITDDPEELDRLLGIDYFVGGFTRATAMTGRRLLFSSLGSEWYPHELVHMVVSQRFRPHPIVRDGFASWIGGWMGGSYAQKMREVTAWLDEHPEVDFDHLVREGRKYRHPGVRYAAGAVLCDLAFMKGGNVAVQELFVGGSTDDALYRTIREIFGVDRDGFEFMWRARLRELR